MYTHSAHQAGATKLPSPHLSIDLVSKSSRSNVYRCRFADGVPTPCRAYSLKTMRVEGRYRQHQRNLLARLVANSRCRAAAGAEIQYGMPRLVASGLIGELQPGTSRAGLLYLVTAWIEGVPLSRLITHRVRAHQPLSLSESLSLLLKVAIALEDLGRCGDGGRLVHQDLKPSNIIVSTASGGQAALIDLDTAFFLGEPTDAVPCGSYGYAAPESIMRCAGWENEAVDVFSFGIVAHEVLTGRWPYPFPPRLRNDLAFWVAYFLGGGGPHIDPTLPDDVRQMVRLCIELDPSARPSVSELVEQAGQLAARYADSSASCAFAGPSEPLPTPLTTPLTASLSRLDLPPDGQSKGVAQ